MAKSEIQSPEERDETQRSLGYVGLSALAHIALLIVVLLAPSFKTQNGEAEGTQAGLEFKSEQVADASPANGPTSTASSEVLLADASDVNAVALPAAAPAAAVTQAAPVAPSVEAPAQAATETKPVEKTAVQLKNPTKPAAALQLAHANKAEPTAEAKPAAPEIQTNNSSDIEAPAAAQETPKLVASNEPSEESEGEATTETAAEPAAEAKIEEPKEEEPVPVQIALPESEALTEEQANELQSPAAKTEAEPAAETKATVVPTQTIAQNSPSESSGGSLIPSNATPISSFKSVRSSNTVGTGLSSPMTGGSQGRTGQNGNTQNQPGASRGGAAGYGVPLGVPVRDARTLIATDTPKPTYPLPDKLAGRQGTTVLVGHVKNDGSVENIALEKSSGSRLMDESAAKAFKSWKYRPGQEGYVRLPVQFQLVGDAKVIPAQLQRQ